MMISFHGFLPGAGWGSQLDPYRLAPGARPDRSRSGAWWQPWEATEFRLSCVDQRVHILSIRSKSQSFSSGCASRHSRVRIITMPAMKCDSSNSKILVLKVGTSTIMTSDARGQRVNVANLSRLVEVIADLRAVGMGCRELGLKQKPTKPEMKRAVAGVGQSRIMRLYSELFETVGMKIAQLLVSQRDFLEQQRWAEIRDTISACLDAGVVPVINENDTTNTEAWLCSDGVRFGDNDNLAALTAVQLEAEGVFLFTDVDFLYTANPNVDPAAEPMKAWFRRGLLFNA
eukprot:Skav230920  [mRNA]  locus=scaffold2578:86362:89846:- [translate_table: standard]